MGEGVSIAQIIVLIGAVLFSIILVGVAFTMPARTGRGGKNKGASPMFGVLPTVSGNPAASAVVAAVAATDKNTAKEKKCCCQDAARRDTHGDKCCCEAEHHAHDHTCDHKKDG